MEWNFTPADAPWQNGCAEAMVKGVKKVIKGAIGEQVLSYSELQTVFSEAANLVNQRSVGRHLTEPEETSYLSSYHLPLGHAFACVPSGPFEETDNSKKTLSIPQDYHRIILEKVVRDYFPTLLIQQKWHTTSEHESRRVKRGSNKVK